MIVGIGTDIVSVGRIEKIKMRWGDRLAQRILHENEFKKYVARSRVATYLATRFAAKEAFAKALGTGIGKISFKDVEVYRLDGGKPAMRFFGYAAEQCAEQAIARVHLSLSDEHTYAVAFVVLER